jgi:hypothetical protein
VAQPLPVSVCRSSFFSHCSGAFVHQVHCSLTVLASFVFIVSTTYVRLAHPFTPDARIKVFFAQMVGLTNVTSAVSRPQLTHAITQLNVIEIYGGRLAATLSSSWSSIDDSESVHCIVCRGLTTCEWPVLLALLPSIASAKGGDKGKWLVANVTRLGPASLHVEIEGIQTRACTISVENYGIRRYRACTHQDGGTIGISAGAPTTWTTFEVPTEKEIRLLTLWARGWGSKFNVEFDVDPDTEQKQKTAGRVSCLWNDGPGHRSLRSTRHAGSCPSGLLSRKLRTDWSRLRADFLNRTKLRCVEHVVRRVDIPFLSLSMTFPAASRRQFTLALLLNSSVLLRQKPPSFHPCSHFLVTKACPNATRHPRQRRMSQDSS